jgi:hypothetical protein
VIIGCRIGKTATSPAAVDVANLMGSLGQLHEVAEEDRSEYGRRFRWYSR